jgi:ribonuclease BN (tRNA processing enzyme)
LTEIVFLGTGGGRINLIKQVRLTGGFRINSESANIHVDPGPGALLNSLKFKQDPLKVDALIVTHDHVDHSNDAMLMCEAMSSYALKKKGILIGSGHVVDGDSNHDRAVDNYHQKLLETIHSAKAGKKKTFTTMNGKFEIEIIDVDHDEPTSFGFKLHIDGKTIGYTSDTNYFDDLGKLFRECDILIANCLKPESDGIPDHLESSHIIRINKVAKPGKTILSHFGLKMLMRGPNSEAERITEESGIETIAAKDGMRIRGF